MIRFIGLIFIFLFIFGSHVKADWFFLQDISTGGKFYTDVETLTDDGEYLYVWTLQDLDKPVISDGKSMLSVKQYDKIDCKLKRSGTLQYIFYEGNMGKGKFTTFQRDQLKWKYTNDDG